MKTGEVGAALAKKWPRDEEGGKTSEGESEKT